MFWSTRPRFQLGLDKAVCGMLTYPSLEKLISQRFHSNLFYFRDLDASLPISCALHTIIDNGLGIYLFLA